MSSDVEEFVRYQVANAPVRRYPFPHIYIQPIFPADYYGELLQRMPATSLLTPIHETGSVGYVDKETGEIRATVQERYVAQLAALEEDEDENSRGDLWRSLSLWLLGDAFRDLIIQKFLPGIRDRFGPGVRLVTEVEGRLVRDFSGYAIKPHTDTPAKLVSLLFYLPRDDSLRRLGTSVYRPIDPGFRCEGNDRHAFQRFHKVATMGFLPNALFGFLKTDQSFHGVETINGAGIERDVLLYNVYVKKILKQAHPAPSGPAWKWPWRRGNAAR